jgi:3-isopropylmalate/(R)-2-methylmalate dehydratase small subunit
MTPWIRIQGRVLPLDRADVDTDQIIPARHLKRIQRAGLGQFAFEDWREDPTCVFNRPEHARAPILVTGPNFGCGSSREHAVWALEDRGIRVILAPSFADIFRSNCSRVGVLTVTFPEPIIRQLMERARQQPESELVVDLEAQVVHTPDQTLGWSFSIDGYLRRCLLEGRDAVAQTLTLEPHILAFEAQRPEFFPWTSRIEDEKT